MRRVAVGGLSALLCLSLACGETAPDEVPAESTGASSAPERQCLTSFDAGRDYFPHKVYPEHAKGFRIEYHRNFKVLRVGQVDAGDSMVYVLSLCGAPEPTGYPEARYISIPVASLITTSTTELPHVLALGYGERLLGHDELDYIVAPELRQRIAAGELVEVGDGAGLDLERILDAGPDLLLVDSPSRAGSAQLGRLSASGIGVVAVPSFLEVSPLGRAEWIKLLAYFFDRESQAEEIFSAVAKRYGELVALAQGVKQRPKVLTSAPLGGTWYLPGGQSFFARLLWDAGGEYLWAEDGSVGSLALDIESVMERGAEAEIWLHPSDWASLAQIRANDPRLARIAAFASGAVFANDARLGPAGGNDYWEQGGARPDLVLADLLAILHPELLPEHRLYFHRRLGAED